MAEFATWWLGTHAARLRAGSVIKYQERLHRLGPLAELAINDVTAEQVADWQTWLLDDTAAGRPHPVCHDGGGHAAPPFASCSTPQSTSDFIRTNPVRPTSSRHESPGQPGGC